MKYQVTQSFQFIDHDHQIKVLEPGETVEQIDEENVKFKIGKKEYSLPLDLILKNPQFFSKIDWRDQLLEDMKQNRKKTTVAVHKQVIQFLDSKVFQGKQLIEYETLQALLQLAMERYNASNDHAYLDIFEQVGWKFDKNGTITKKF